ncbi:nucleotide-binding protein [Alicyclobacillus hesperidum subsp. aegles]|uniref:Nucleotide-binding protein n=1 Tax=Alicyclobacillus hesperidum TaxID=89784 RepID=A0AA37TZG5_9BACL|nr:RNase adapter RapZ [Alicyclobacillus hesperidum]KRW91264.1 glmZ(sRNA)-inactivating NTPase [Alicyclobacillus tengchongensis]GLG01347.1 nucleotide-binding protein [Alicyclobacillus hesperidum subsp. aegles]GLV14552.1 nucleotide-binding protein [Alicyclobacillus hesperidum]
MTSRLQTVVLTGMSGAGKSVAMQAFEDFGFFCVDNLPPALIPRLLDMAEHASGRLAKMAFGCDLRGGELFEPLLQTLKAIRERKDAEVQLVFLDADDATLVRRYKESRRRHPLAQGARLLESIQEERVALAAVRQAADAVIDTSQLTANQLKQELGRRFVERVMRLPVHVMSFGFKYGVPLDADMVLDVRFLPNPHYIDGLRPYTGEDDPVYQYVMQWPATQEFLKKTEDMLDFLIPEYQREGKSHLVVGIGCTGGKHRSVAIAKHIANHLAQAADVELTHRDFRREG